MTFKVTVTIKTVNSMQRKSNVQEVRGRMA